MKFKKMLGVAMSVMMITGACAIPTMVSAATVSVSAGDTHTYDVYQIFKGELNDAKKGFVDVSKVEWGSGVNSADLGSAMDKVNELTDANVKDFAKELVDGKLAEKSGSVSDGQSLTDLEDGYYLLVDTATNPTDAISAYMLKVAGDVTVNPKKNIPTVEKKVKDNDETTDWQDVADYGLGDNIPFQLTAKLGAESLDDYNKYRLVFHDTLSDGLTSNDDYTVTIGGVTYSSDNFEANGISVTNENNKITIIIKDVKALGATAGSEIVVNYTAQLNDAAIIGEQGNPNEVTLSYSNNPNYEYKGTGDGDKETPDDDDDDDGKDDDDETGETEKDEVLVLTFEFDVTKIDGITEDALTGAKFALYKGETLIKEIDGSDSASFEFSKLDAGVYTLKEIQAPPTYNPIDDITFTIEATHRTDLEDGTNTNITGLVVKQNGEIVSSSEENSEAKFSVDVAGGKVSTKIANYQGDELPETGGMGTRVIYTLGGLLVLGASVLLVTKRRMGENE